MKTIIIAINLIILTCGTYSQSGWFWQNPLPSGSDIEDIFFLNQNTGYAAGWNGTILKSTNAGSNWINLNSGVNYIFYSVCFVNEFTGFSASADFIDHTYRGAIVKTTNGGLNWVETIFESTSFSDMCFVNQNTGFACGVFDDDYAVLYKTTNCGSNWNTVNSLPSSFWFTSIQFLDENTGFISDQQKLIRTTNGGLNWIILGENILSGILDIEFVNFNTGYAAGNYGRVYKTNNSGMNWTQVHSDPTTHMTSSLFLNENTGYICGKNRNTTYPGKLKRTTNGGVTWDSIYYSSMANLNDICLAGNSDVFLLGGVWGELVKSTNSGTNWNSIRSSLTSTGIMNIKFNGSNTGVVVGFDDVFLKTTDNGFNWSTISTGTGFKFRDIAYLDENTLMIAGDYGKFVKSTNGGLNWTNIDLGNSYQGLRNMIFVDQATGFVSGSGAVPIPPYNSYGVVYKTTNGGSNWTFCVNTLFSTFYSCYFLNANTGFVSRTTSDWLKMQIRTENGGQSWSEIEISNHVTHCFFFLNEQTGFSGGTGQEGASLLRTTDGGLNWNTMNLYVPSSTQINSIFFTNPNNGFMVCLSFHDYGRGGDILKTVDGGLTWYRYTSFPSFPSVYKELNTIYFIDQNTGFVGGGQGTILKTTDGGNILNMYPNNVHVSTNFSLHQNYPNPFNPVTRIKFDIPKSSYTKILIYDVLGKLVTTLVNENLKPGSYEVEWDGSWYASGVYFYSIVTDEFVETKRMVLVK